MNNKWCEIKDGRLYFDGCDTVRLAETYGTPVYLLSESAIKEKCAEIRQFFLERYENTRAAYAAKAFLTVGLCRIIEREGLGLDVVSGGELYTAIKANFPPERIEFNGNNKTAEELELAVSYGIGRIIVDHPAEIATIAALCRKHRRRMVILLRLNPGVEAHTHSYITTGHRTSKFGILLDEEVFWPALKEALATPEVEFLGFHFHIGSQLFDYEGYQAALAVVLDRVAEVKQRLGVIVRELNIGGGFGARYLETDEPKPYTYFLDPLMRQLTQFADDLEIARPALVIEPGRSIVAEAGLTLYRVGTIKRIPEGPTYVAVDGGMTDNIRPALYQAEYAALLADKADQSPADKVTVCGKCCESGDILIRDVALAAPQTGNILAMFSTGAYGYAMASNYNKIPIPPVVLVHQGEAGLMVRRQTYEDLVERETVD